MNEIVEQFSIDGKFLKSEKVGIGHIHHSSKITTTEDTYFLQRVNDRIFDPSILSKNLDIILRHLQASYQGSPYQSLELISTKQGKTTLKWNGKHFRMYRFMSGMRSFDVPESLQMIFEGAKAFAVFSKNLIPLDPKTIREPIRDFQSIRNRLNQLNEATTHCEEYLLSETGAELSMISKFSKYALQLEKAWQDGVIPTRIVHNDTKFNNLLFDDQGRARCVVDLDTVMPGIIHFDLGDGLRTTATLVDEDEKNLSKVVIDQDRHDSFLEGYLAGFGEELTDKEMEYVPLAGFYMAFLTGVRFLTDFLNGDQYYHTRYPDHNLDRARCQLHLAHQFLIFNNVD